MLELRPKLNTSKQEAAVSTICLKHNDPLKVYCETCHQVICRDCAVSQEHKTHDYNLISECYTKHYQQLQKGLVQIKQEITNIDVAVSHLDDREKEVLQHGERLTEEINTHAQETIYQIVRSRIHLSQQVDTIVQQKTLTLRAQKQQAHKIHTQLKTCQETIECNLKEWNQLQILAEKQEMLKEIKTATQNVNANVFEPSENSNIELAKAKQIQTEIGTISSTTYGKATLKAPPCIAKESSTATLSLQSQDGSPFPLPPSLISSTLFSPSDNEVSVKCNVTQINPRKYNITFTPTVPRGEHLLTVQVGGVDIPNSPFTLPVIPNGERPVMIIKGLNGPIGIAVCTNGDIAVAECKRNCITIFNKKGEMIRSIKRTTLGEFNCPYGVAISNDGHILVTDNHRLKKLTTGGVCVQSVGSYSNHGNGPLGFNHPKGIAVHPTTGEIFVADYGNNRIQVFDGADLSFSHTIRHRNITKPWDIAVDSEGYLYITGSGTHGVYKFTTKGQYIHTIDTINNSRAIFLAIHHKHIYITDSHNSRVLIYDTNGLQLYSFGTRGSGEGEFNGPMGIAVDTSGNVYVCDSGNNRIAVY